MHLMSSSWMTACNFSRIITFTVCNHMRVVTRISMYLRVRCVDTAWKVRVVHAPYACVMLQSLRPVLYVYHPSYSLFRNDSIPGHNERPYGGTAIYNRIDYYPGYPYCHNLNDNFIKTDGNSTYIIAV